MAMNLGCNIRQIARHFLAVKGGNLRLSSGLAGARQKARTFHTVPSSNNRLRRLSDVVYGMPFSVAIVCLGGTTYWYSFDRRVAKLGDKCSTCKAKEEVYESQRKRMEEREEPGLC